LIFDNGTNVGISNTSPAYKLDVSGDINITGSFRINGVAIGGGSGTVTGTGTTNYIAKWSGSSALTNSLIFDNGTNVGIGTASITSYYGFVRTLSVEGTNAEIQLRATGTNLVASFGTADNGTYLQSATQPLIINVNSGERIRITSAGNVGISTTTPSEKLEVLGNIRATSSGTTYFLANRGTTTSQAGFQWQTNGTTNWYNYTEDSANTLFWYGNGAYRMALTSSGNLGIGTNAPLAYSGYTTVQASNTTGAGIYAESTTGAMRVKMFADNAFGASYIGTETNHGLALFTNNTEKIRITSGGDIGIGTTTPSAGYGGTIANVKLAIRNGTPGSTGGTSVLLIGGDNNHYASITGSHTGGGNTYLAFATSTGATNPSEKMRIEANGKIGIGTSNPTEKFNIYTNEYMWALSIQHAYSSGGQFYVSFLNNSGTQTGSIVGNGTSTAFNTTSDYRLKEDLKPIKGLDKLSKINVYDFKWKSSNERMDGVIAHELQEILPYAVFGVKDGKNNQQVDYSKIVPVLVQAIKELREEINLLKAK
jgi:hypothetical protein